MVVLLFLSSRRPWPDVVGGPTIDHMAITCTTGANKGPEDTDAVLGLATGQPGARSEVVPAYGARPIAAYVQDAARRAVFESAPMALSFDHVGLSLMATNIDATIDWYVSKLDFTVEQRWEVNGVEFAFIAHRDVGIELIGAASTPGDEPADNIAKTHTVERLHHLCFAVENLEATLADLHDRGVDPISETMQNITIGQRFTFITDACGNIIELTEPGYRSAQTPRDGSTLRGVIAG